MKRGGEMRAYLQIIIVMIVCGVWIGSLGNISYAESDCERNVKELDKQLLIEKARFTKRDTELKNTQQEVQRLTQELQRANQAVETMQDKLQSTTGELQKRTVYLTTFALIVGIVSSLFGIFLGVRTRQASRN